ncbi:hypothetical protein PHPALM_28053 [Phytophthora palmivora]|uniref:Tc1-like transposase DDE domain-containing protein n=1 Tax=Phytophthora palmivora TaxID=4796 RepID=A0A2P4XB29_9STRA|nr:hypothetical protein PHPALM_28053 [Phytophthora palmivora]
MPSQSRITKHTVLDAYRSGNQNWLTVAASNDIPPTTAYDLVNRGRAENLPRGGARHVKMTPEAKTCLEGYLNDDCTYTMQTMKTMLFLDCGIKVDTSTIKTNYNVYLNRLRGRAKRGERAVVKIPPSKGANLQLQCAVSSLLGLVAFRLQRGSIRMDKNAAFVEEIYRAVKASDTFQQCYNNKKVVIVLDNAPAHRQTEERVTKHADMELLRLGPYSPMCNPIEGCFSVLKAHIKTSLALARRDICNRSHEPNDDGEVRSIAERQMRILERAAKANMKVITPALVTSMEKHCRDAINLAAENKDMVYGK